MRFLAGEQLHEAVRRVLQGSDARCAVAFWGNGAESTGLFVDANTAKIVCNLSMGGTNPGVIRTLKKRGADVRQLDVLHAKVYIGRSAAVVASANASSNGLALEGLEQTHWSEAGVEIELNNAADVISWFDHTWSQSREITEQDLRRAEILWRARRRLKPTVSFANYDVDAEARDGTLPVPCWWSGTGIWKADPERTKEVMGYYEEGMFTLEFEDEQDTAVVSPGTWLLWWHRGATGIPRKDKLTFAQVGKYVPGVMRHLEGELENIGALLSAAEPGQEPFDASDDRFVKAFKEVICRPQFEAYRSDEGPPWFITLALELTNFWQQLKQRYLELPDS